MSSAAPDLDSPSAHGATSSEAELVSRTTVRSDPGFLGSWLLTSLGLIILFPLVTVCLINERGDREAFWIQTLYQRKGQGADRRIEPRILFFGGSSGHFGIDAERMERHLRRPVHNLCTHGALELNYQIDRIQRHARPGDTVVLAFETGLYRAASKVPSEILWNYVWTYDRFYWLRTDPETAASQIWGVPLERYITSFRNLDSHLRGDYYRRLYQARIGYSTVQLSPNGDNRQWIAPSSKDRKPDVPPPRVASEARRNLHRLVAWAKSRDITLVGAWPPFHAGRPVAPAEFEPVHELWKACGIKALDPAPHSYLPYPSAFYSDTLYHLNFTGRLIHTDRLRRMLARHLNLPSPTSTNNPVLLLHGPDVEDAMTPSIPDFQLRMAMATASDAPHPDVIAPWQLSERGGHSLHFLIGVPNQAVPLDWFKDRGPALATNELRLATWLQRYTNHLFLAVKDEPEPIDGSGLPSGWTAFTGSDQVAIGLFGSGRWSHVCDISQGSDEVRFHRRAFDARDGLRLEIDLTALAGRRPSARELRLNGMEASRGPKGLHVAVLDPILQLAPDVQRFDTNGVGWTITLHRLGP